jgi:hypothetical protein
MSDDEDYRVKNDEEAWDPKIKMSNFLDMSDDEDYRVKNDDEAWNPKIKMSNLGPR